MGRTTQHVRRRSGQKSDEGDPPRSFRRHPCSDALHNLQRLNPDLAPSLGSLALHDRQSAEFGDINDVHPFRQIDDGGRSLIRKQDLIGMLHQDRLAIDVQNKRSERAGVQGGFEAR